MSLDHETPDAPLKTVDDLQTLPDTLRYELIDGRLVLLDYPLAHQHLKVELCRALERQIPLDSLVVHSLPLAIDAHNELRPDVVVISLDHAVRSPVPVSEVLLAVDVVSEVSHFRDLYAKSKIYAAAGVTDYWIVDPWFPDRIELSRLRLGIGGTYEMVDTARVVCTTMLPFPVTIDLLALSAARQSLLNRIGR
jgi:Uma2 family endonuclease